MAEKLLKNINLHMQEAQRTPSRINAEIQNRHFILKISKPK